MTETEQKIWDTVNTWCDGQAQEIPDQNRRYLMDEIRALVLADVGGNEVAVCMCTTSTYNALTDNCLKCGKKYSG